MNFIHSTLLTWLLLAFSLSAQAQFTLDRESPGPSSRRTGLAITEIMYNPRPVPGVSTNLTLEFIELYNSYPWDENIGGFAIDGVVHFDFPAGTVLAAGGYLVVARVPELVETEYGITGVFGPWDGASTNRLSTERGLVQLRNRQGAVLLEIDYRDSPPWPEGADGTGHSLSLVRPSFGEGDDRAWAQSDHVGGSPGEPDPLSAEPLASVLINEWQNHSDPVDWLELYNHANTPVDVSGAYLSDDPSTNKFRIPNGTIIPARGFLAYDQNQLGFELFAGGETMFLVNSDQTRVIDVIDFRGQSNNISSGRFPDGGPLHYGLATRTQGGPNSRPTRYAVTINEIMYNPISGDSDEEYVELHNWSNRSVNLAGWEFVVGISYTFPTNPITMNMPPGAYWVVARNPTNLFAIYPNLNTNNTFGPFDGSLANGGERLLFAAADYDRVNNGGIETIERLNVPVSDLTYHDGGKWGAWSDGLGSSLELIDPEADVHHSANWADSDDTPESLWTALEADVPLGETLGESVNDSLIVMLQGIGECLVDEIEVRVNQGANFVANGDFESGLANWSLQGSHDFSTLEHEGFSGTKSLHLRAGSRGDNQSNRILSAPFASPLPPGTGTVSVRAKVKWLRGHPEILLRLHGSGTELYGRMAVPRRLGSPAQVNSGLLPRAGPAIYDVRPTPALPAENQDMIVTARATDPEGVTLIKVRYRIDPDPDYADLTMADDGTAGDAVADDGIYTAIVPGQPAGTMAAFYLEATDAQNTVGTFPQNVLPDPGFTRCWPNDAVARECVVRWGETQMPGDFATYHLWVTSANSNRWHHRDVQNNTALDGTFVYNNARIIYNALPLFSGSPWHRTNSITGPAGPNRVDYEMNFPDDDPLLGSTDFVLNNPGNPDILTISDLSAVAEQTVYRIFEAMGMPHNHRRYMHFFVNGSQRSTAYERPGNFIFEDSQQPNGDMIEQWFPDDAGGQLFKVEDWFEFEPNGFDITTFNDADLTRRTVIQDGQPALNTAAYRFMFRKRSIGAGSANDFSQLFALINAVSPTDNPDSATIDPDLFGTVADWEEWMRHFAVQRAVGNWDSYGWERGKNDYLYRASTGFRHMPWDIDYSLGLGRPANEPLFESNDPRIAAMFNTPEIVRAYWRAFADLVAGPFSNAHLDPSIDARASALTRNDINIDADAVAAIKSYIGQRRAFLLEQLAGVSAPFAVEGPLTFATSNNLVHLRGTAPVQVKQISLNDSVYPVTWTTESNFFLRVVLHGGLNEITLQGLDRSDMPIEGFSQMLNLDYTGPVVEPAGALVINEVMALTSPGAQFVEIRNVSSHHFDLSGWHLEGVGFDFPIGSIVTNGQTIVLARNRETFRATYPGIPLFGLFNSILSAQAQTLRLIKPGSMEVEIIDAVRYEAAAPWPIAEIDLSLQLIDATQDNTRPSNWAVDLVTPSTPGEPNSVATALSPFDPVWLNEAQIESLTGPVDNMGESEPWVELYNSGNAPLSLEGYFLADGYSGDLLQWAFPPGTVIQPGEFKLVWADSEVGQTAGTNLHASFRLRNQGQLALVRLADGLPQITDYLSWDLNGVNLSYGDFFDGQLITRFALHDPTPGSPNARRPLAVMVNEWMARNSGAIRDPADQDFDDWFEIYNAELQTVDLGGFYLTDDLANPTKFSIPDNGQYQIPPGGFLLVWADNEPAQNGADQNDLHSGFQLSGSAGDIAIFAPDGLTLIDGLSYGEQTTDISEGRYGDGTHARYSMPRDTPRGFNSIPDYNTPPRLPAVPDQLVAPGIPFFINLRALDPDGQPLVYTVEEGPAGTAITQAGTFRWIVPPDQSPGNYPVRVGVVDDGLPPRQATTSFNLIVPTPGGPVDPVDPVGPSVRLISSVAGQVSFIIETNPGRTYRVFYKDNLSADSWVQLSPDFVAANSTASFTDALLGGHRFYVVQVDN